MGRLGGGGREQVGRDGVNNYLQQCVRICIWVSRFAWRLLFNHNVFEMCNLRVYVHRPTDGGIACVRTHRYFCALCMVCGRLISVRFALVIFFRFHQLRPAVSILYPTSVGFPLQRIGRCTIRQGFRRTL